MKEAKKIRESQMRDDPKYAGEKEEAGTREHTCKKTSFHKKMVVSPWCVDYDEELLRPIFNRIEVSIEKNFGNTVDLLNTWHDSGPYFEVKCAVLSYYDARNITFGSERKLNANLSKTRKRIELCLNHITELNKNFSLGKSHADVDFEDVISRAAMYLSNKKSLPGFSNGPLDLVVYRSTVFRTRFIVNHAASVMTSFWMARTAAGVL